MRTAAKAPAVNHLQVVLPGTVDDPERPSGGNVYDRRLCRELAAAGWSVHEHAVGAGWPRPGPDDLAALRGVLTGLPAASVVLLDGLVACSAAEVLLPQVDRVRCVVLVHQLLVDGLPEPSRTVREQERAGYEDGGTFLKAYRPYYAD